MGSLRYYWIQLRSALWFLPLLLSIVSVGAALLLLAHGEALGRALGLHHLRFPDPEIARGMLESLLNGMIAMTALVVSITMVVLTLAAAQLGPRLIRDFTDDLVTQFVLGLFTGTILYLLVILQSMGTRQDEQLPDLAVVGATLLSASCLFVLLLYINRLAQSIVSNHLLRRVAIDLRGTSSYVQESGLPGWAHEEGGDAAAWDVAADHVAVAIDEEGYVQNIDYAAILAAVVAGDALVRLRYRPGDWIDAGSIIADVAPPSAGSDQLKAVLRKALAIGSTRTPSQDLEFGLQRLVEVGVRALSPSLNDPFTAIAAIDNIGASLAWMFKREIHQPAIRDRSGKLRLLCPIVKWRLLVDAGFDQIRHFGAEIPVVAVRLLDTLGRLAASIRNEEQRHALLEQLDAVLASARIETMVAKDAELLEARHRAARQALAEVILPGSEPALEHRPEHVPEHLPEQSREHSPERLPEHVLERAPGPAVELSRRGCSQP
jgi:uncharacterized membrane protein